MNVDEYVPTRRTLPFHKTARDQAGEFFERHFVELMVEIHTLVSHAFSPKDELKVPKMSPWLHNHSDEFLYHVELVARSDPSNRHWENLLRNDTERVCLLHAILMKFLDTEVFSSLLFGADLEHHRILESTDVSLVNTEGFRRSSLRAHTNRVYLEPKGGQPPLFWEEVDALCAQAMSMLAPEHEWISRIAGRQSAVASIQELHQWLHEIISYAGWLSICVQTSRAIVSYDWVAPGERYQLDQVNFAHQVYEQSRKSAKKNDKRRLKRRQSAEVPKRGARVKISMAPKIVRSVPAKDAFGTTGIETYTVLEPHVVYYEGRFDDLEDAVRLMSLPEYIQRLRGHKSVPHGAALLIMVLVALFIWMTSTSSGQNTWASIKQDLADVGAEGNTQAGRGPGSALMTLSAGTVSKLKVLQPEVVKILQPTEVVKLLQPAEVVRLIERGGHVATTGSGLSSYLGLGLAAYALTHFRWW